MRVSTEDIILKPMYFFISDFVGDYVAFQNMDEYWGVLARTGKVVVPAKYKKVELLPRGKVRLSFAIGTDKIVSIKKLIKFL